MSILTREPRLGERVHVRCMCLDGYCKAPGRMGGKSGELVDKQGDLWSVFLDGESSALDFPRRYVRIVLLS